MESYFRSLQKKLSTSHRGYWGYDNLTQNTIPAYQEAIRLNVDFIERDVHATKDGVLILHHDPDIKFNDNTSFL